MQIRNNRPRRRRRRVHARDRLSLACMHTEMHSRVRVVYDTVAQRKSQFIRDQSVLRLHIVHTCRQRSMRRALALVARSQCAMKTLIPFVAGNLVHVPFRLTKSISHTSKSINHPVGQFGPLICQSIRNCYAPKL